jgi:hypothetical protein
MKAGALNSKLGRLSGSAQFKEEPNAISGGGKCGAVAGGFAGHSGGVHGDAVDGARVWHHEYRNDDN